MNVPAKGTRIEAHPATDAWISGDRYGVVIGRTRSHLHDTEVFGIRVKMDRSGIVRVFHPRNVLILDPSNLPDNPGDG